MFYERLRALRKDKKLTQIQLAEMLSVSNGTVAMWETNKRTPDSETLAKIAAFFDVSVDYLLGLTDTKKQPATKDELQNEIMERFAKLSPPQQEKAIAFIQGLLASQE